MSARRWISSTAPASSTAARCSSPAAPRRWSAIRTCAASISVRASSFSIMGLGPRLDLRQSQSLVMTPQLQQAIRLLALSNLEVESFIAEELERNPLLDTGGADDTAPAAEAAPEATEPATSDEPMLEGGGDGALDLDLNDENIHQDSAADRALDGGLALEGIGGGGSEGEGPDFDSFEAGDVSLHEHLVAQAGERLGPADFLIARMIIEQ